MNATAWNSLWNRFHYFLAGCLFLLVISACTPTTCQNDPACTQVLFIGNSYTYVNDLPAVLVKLASSGGHRLETGMAAEGGWSLSDHLKASSSLQQITSKKWNYVVLQEQSQLPANQYARDQQMIPSVANLTAQITATGAKPVLFVTWGHRDGWPDNGMPEYEGMQLAINYAYLTAGKKYGTIISPVGYAWLALQRRQPKVDLWQADGSHPNIQGTYLAACVFYATLFQQSPLGLSYKAGLNTEEATLLQQTAADIVLNNTQKWNLH